MHLDPPEGLLLGPGRLAAAMKLEQGYSTSRSSCSRRNATALFRADACATRTRRNQTYFWTVYSLGLRLTEALHLQIGDIDGTRKLVHIHRGKGAKDRYVPLPSRTLQMLREHWAAHRHPCWLFPAVGRGGKAAATAAQIRKKS